MVQVLASVTANLHLYTKRSASFLDLKMKAHKRKLAKQSLGRTLHLKSDARLACLLGTKRCQFVLFVLAAVKIALIAHTVSEVQRPMKYSSFRLTGLDPAGSVSAFGVLSEDGGCLHRVAPDSVQNNPSLVASYDHAVSIEGVYLTLAPNVSSTQSAR